MGLDSTKFRLGPGNIYLFESAAFVLIGYVDNISVSFTPTGQDLHGGQNGTSRMDTVITGTDGNIKFDCQQIELANFARALKSIAQKFQGVITPANHRLEFQVRAGQGLRTLATQLKLVPFVGGIETTNVEEILNATFAAPSPETLTFALSNTTQRIIPMNFVLYPDDTKRNRLAYFGDDTADTSAAGVW